MENTAEQQLAAIDHLLASQLTDPDKIRMADSTTFAYRFSLTPRETACLSLPPQTPQADILLDLMMEFMTVKGLDENGTPIADGRYPDAAKKFFIPRIFDLYGRKLKEEKEKGVSAQKETPEQELPMTAYLQSESYRKIRRFYLNYPALDADGKKLHLYIETEIDDEDNSYINYWVGCEEYTAKRYIASRQAGLDDADLLEAVQAKHLNFYLKEIFDRKA